MRALASTVFRGEVIAPIGDRSDEVVEARTGGDGIHQRIMCAVALRLSLAAQAQGVDSGEVEHRQGVGSHALLYGCIMGICREKRRGVVRILIGVLA